MVSFPYPKQKDPDHMEINIQNVSMTYPQRKTGPAEPESGAPVSQPHRPAGAQNGAGKSTLMKLLVAALLPTSGSILVDGQPFSRWSGS